MTEIISFAWHRISSVIEDIILYLFGEWDFGLKILLTLIILDYIMGICKAIYLKCLSSEICLVGIVKKMFILSVVVVSNLIQTILENTVPIRDIIIVFYSVNEAISILENASRFILIPSKLYEVIQKIKEKNG